MPVPTLEQLEKLKNEKQDIDTEQTDQEVMEGIDLVTDEADNLNKVVGALGNDTMQQLLLAEPDMERDMDVLSETIEQIRNGMLPQQAAATRQKLEIQKASAAARQQDQEKQTGEMAMEPKGTAEELQQQTQSREPAMTDMDHLSLIEKSQKAKGSRRFKAVRQEYKTIGAGGWIARVFSHALLSAVTAVQTVFNQAARLGSAVKRRVIRWKNGTAKEEEARQAAEMYPQAAGQEQMPDEQQAQPPAQEQETEQRGDDQEISVPADKVPRAWEERIAENPKQKPYVSVDIRLKDEKSLNDLLADADTSLALYYTRQNEKTGKMERCRAKFGFHAGGNMNHTSVALTQLGLGTYVPGRLMDDKAKAVTVGKRYAATNQQINQILQEAADYPSGGYHMIKRNCTTFAADLTQRAGIDTGDVLKQQDLNMGALWLAAPLLPLVSVFTKKRAEKHVKTELGRETDDGTDGNPMMAEKQLQRFQEGDNNLMRLNGYMPAAAAERMRRGSATMLHASDYEGIKGDFAEKFENESQLLQNAVRNVVGADYEDDIRELDQQLKNKQKVFLEKSGKLWELLDQQSIGRTEEINNLRTEMVDELQGLRKYLSEWYYGVAEGDRRLNLPFMHMASILENEENRQNREYGLELLLYEDSLDEIDETRDVAPQLHLLDEGKQYQASIRQQNDGDSAGAQGDGYSGLQMVAMVKVFGSLQAGMEAYGRQKELAEKKEKDPLLERKLQKVEQMKNALGYDKVRNGMTQADANFAFEELPEKMKGDKISGADKIAGVYQALAYEKVYGGMKVWLSNIAQDHQFDSVVLEDFVTDYLLEGTQKDAFGMILSSIQDALGDQKSDEEVYQYLVENFSKVYLEQVLRSVLDRGNDDADNPDAVDKYLKQLQTDERSTKIKAFREAVLAQSAKVRSKKREKNRQ